MLKSYRRRATTTITTATTTTIKSFENEVFIFLNPQRFETSQAFETGLAVTSGNKNKFDFSKIVLVFTIFQKKFPKKNTNIKTLKLLFSMLKQRCLIQRVSFEMKVFTLVDRVKG